MKTLNDTFLICAIALLLSGALCVRFESVQPLTLGTGAVSAFFAFKRGD